MHKHTRSRQNQLDPAVSDSDFKTQCMQKRYGEHNLLIECHPFLFSFGFIAVGTLPHLPMWLKRLRSSLSSWTDCLLLANVNARSTAEWILLDLQLLPKPTPCTHVSLQYDSLLFRSWRRFLTSPAHLSRLVAYFCMSFSLSIHSLILFPRCTVHCALCTALKLATFYT